jgi:hypothetical protein
MMQDLIKAFTTYASPDTDAQRKQYQRMLDLTRSAANACTGLYGYGEQFENREVFIDLHLAELKALAHSNNRNGIKTKYHCFETVIQEYRNNQSRTEQCRKTVLEAETALLEAIHKLETESRLDNLRRIDWILIGITIVLLLVLWLEVTQLINLLPQSIENLLPDVLKDQGWLILVAAWVFVLLLVRKWHRRDNTKDHGLDTSKQANRASVDGDSNT